MTLPQISRRLFLAGLLATTAYPIAAKETRPKARDGVAASKAGVSTDTVSGHTNYVVMDVASGKIVQSHGMGQSLPPASVAKTVTALYALEYLGAGFRFTTQVIATGPIQNGIVQGDLILSGSADPSLDTDGLNELVTQVASKGIRGITGAFRYYGGAVPYEETIDKDQPDHVGYSPAISGLNLNYNRVHFGWKRAKRGYEMAMDARSDHIQPAVSMVTMAIKDRQTPLFTYAKRQNSESWTVASAALGKGGTRWMPVRLPDLYAADVFHTLCAGRKIKLPKPQNLKTPPSGTAIAARNSETLDIVIRDMLKYSTNLTAEVLGMTASARRTGKQLSLRASAREMTQWAQGRFGMRSLKLVDHSGLSDVSRVEASDMAKMYLMARQTGQLRPLLKSIGVPKAKSGATFQGTVDAKTGTLNFVSGLGGYLTTASGREMVFGIFSADMKKHAAVRKSEREAPAGGSAWNKRAKALQYDLLRDWAQRY